VSLSVSGLPLPPNGSVSLFERRFMRSRTAPPPEAPADPGCDQLEALFAAHGVPTRREDGWIELPGQEMAADARLSRHRPDTCELEVRLALPDGRVIIERCAGAEADAAEAERDAWRGFTLSSFHPLLRGVLLGGTDDQVDVEEWTVGGALYRVVIGAANLRGIDGAELPGAWFPALHAAVCESGVGEELSWVRFFFGQLNGQGTIEVLLNNESWVAVATAMRTVEWPKAEGYYSVRLFLTLTRI
jgi:hypothetical protein